MYIFGNGKRSLPLHKGPIMGKVFPCHDIVLKLGVSTFITLQDNTAAEYVFRVIGIRVVIVVYAWIDDHHSDMIEAHNLFVSFR